MKATTQPPFPSGRAADHLEASARPARQPLPLAARARVRRPRVEARLDRAAARRLTLIVSAAGSGKTTALAQWAQITAAPVGWVTATADEAATHAAVRAALQEAPRLPGRPVVVVDDAHRLPARSLPLIEEWLDSGDSADVNLVLAGRRDLPLPVVALELVGDVTEIRSDVLAFSEPEARELIALHAPDASEADMAAVRGRAQGWAAALVLGARAMAGAGHDPQAREGLSRTERPVLDYLLGEVFATLPAMVRHVLLCTGDLDEVTDDAAAVLSGDPAAGRRLAELAADGVLVTQYQGADGGTPRVWRYHPLLQELLRRQTAYDGPDHALAVAAHVRAAGHYAVHGPIPEAIRHAARAQDDDLLIDLLVAETPALIGAGHVELLNEALRSLPADATETAPGLLGVMALAQLGAGDQEAAARLAVRVRPAVDDTRRTPADRAELVPTILADGALLATWQARIGWLDPRVAISNAREVLGCSVPPDTDGQLSHPSHRPMSPLSLPRVVWLLNELTVTELWTSDLKCARAHNEEALEAAGILEYPALLADAWANRAMLDAILDDPQAAVLAAEQSLAAVRPGGREADPVTVRCHVVLAWAALCELRFSDAVHHLRVSQRIGVPAGAPMAHLLVGIVRAGLAAEAGDLAAARGFLTALTSGADRAGRDFRMHVLRARAEWAFRSRNAEALAGEIDRMRELHRADGVALFSPLLAALGGDVAAAVEELTAFTEAHGDGVLPVIAAASRLGLLLDGDDAPAVHRAYRDVMDRVADRRLLRALAFADLSNPRLGALVRQDAAGPAPHPLTPDLSQALARHRAFRRAALEPSLSDELGLSPARDAVSTSIPEQAAADRAGSGPPARVPPSHFPGLTVRERDVLNELALGGAYSDIARNLYVTENTVKTHIISVYRKLGVDRRADALRRARETGLLG